MSLVYFNGGNSKIYSTDDAINASYVLQPITATMDSIIGSI